MQNPKKDLYSILGVERNSDKNTIKKAYKNKSKKEHPDVKGGSVEKFGALKKAYDILINDERRKKYDSIGDDSEKSPDNDYANAINTIALAFAFVLQKCAESGKSPLETNIIQSVRNKIDNDIDEANKQIRVLSKMLDIDKKMKGRFSVENGENIFEGIVDNRIMCLDINISNLKKNIDTSKRSLDIIKYTDYKSDPEPYESPGDRMMRVMSTSSYFA